MAFPITRSPSHEEAIEKVSVLKRVCQDSHVSRKVVSLALIAVGIILFISGILLLTLTITGLSSTFSIALGATVLTLGTSLISFGIAIRILRKPPSDHQEDILASEMITVKKLVEQKTQETSQLQGEVSHLQAEINESQKHLTEVSEELDAEKLVVADLRSRLQQSEDELTQVKDENTVLQTRLQEAETTIGEKEEHIQELQSKLTAEKLKVQQLEDRVKELVIDVDEKSKYINLTEADLSTALTNQENLITKLTNDFETEVSRLQRLLFEKTVELDAAKSTFEKIQQRLDGTSQTPFSSPMRKSTSTISLNKGDQSPSLRSRWNTWRGNISSKKEQSTSNVVTFSEGQVSLPGSQSSKDLSSDDSNSKSSSEETKKEE
ncbi:incA family protein [Chlamydia sp. 12-01]|uniref:incA family protein n=1 Tax=Chlamydia sp. 12-01 TaxID=3002742 RepID=UPI0035D4AF5F